MNQDNQSDREHEEQRRWDRLKEELRPGMEADESEFVDFDPEAIIAEAKKRKCISS